MNVSHRLGFLSILFISSCSYFVTGSSDVSTGGDLIPALGESWSHSCTTSIQLNFVHVETSQNKKNIVREVNIMKSPLVKYPSKAFFTISEEGVRDLDTLKKA